MAVGVKVGSIISEIGSSSFLKRIAQRNPGRLRRGKLANCDVISMPFEDSPWLAAGSFNGFFSTIVRLLENGKAGSRYPIISKEFYRGHLSHEQAPQAIVELESIQKEFLNYPPMAVIWDLEDRSQTPPWGDSISPTITSMANYFVTSACSI